MKSMRASVLNGAGSVEVQSRPRPEAGPGEVLVRIAAVGVCGSDIHYYREGAIGPHVVDAPLVLGHEASGRVEAVGDGVDRALVGRRVAIEPGVPDRTCIQCRTGHYNLCPDMRFFATPPIDGAFVEYIVHPADFVYPLPDDVSDEAGGLVEPLSVAIWACRKAEVALGDRVLIAGAGPVGLLVAQVARVCGASRVVVSDVSTARRSAALTLGADATFDPREGSPDPSSADVFIDCSGVAGAIVAGLEAVRPGGIGVLVGLGSAELQIPMAWLQDRELTVRGIFRYANTWPEAIELISSGAVDVDSLVTSHHDLDHVEDALRVDPQSGIKAVVHP